MTERSFTSAVQRAVRLLHPVAVAVVSVRHAPGRDDPVLGVVGVNLLVVGHTQAGVHAQVVARQVITGAGAWRQLSWSLQGWM